MADTNLSTLSVLYRVFDGCPEPDNTIYGRGITDVIQSADAAVEAALLAREQRPQACVIQFTRYF